MKITVTGGVGFIGQKLVTKLLEQGHEVTSWDLQPHPSQEAKSYVIDILDDKEVRDKLEPCDAVYHLAGPLFGSCKREPAWATQLQIQGTTNLLEAVKSKGVKKFILASSFYVYDGMDSGEKVDENTELVISRMSLFGAIKAMSERLTQIYSEINGFDYSILRFGSTYGCGDSSNAVKDFLSIGLDGKVIEVWGKGYRRNQYTFVDDVVTGSVLALNNVNGIYNLVSPEVTTTAELAQIVTEEYGFEIKFLEDKKEGASMPYITSDLAQKQLKWSTIPLNKGLQQMVNEMKHPTC